MAQLHKELDGRVFHGETVSGGRVWPYEYTVTIRDDFTYDIKKSDSLLTPVIGELWIEGRADGKLAGGFPVAGKWVKHKIGCGYRNGRWHHDSKVEGLFHP